MKRFVAVATLLIAGCGGSSPAPSPTRAAKATTKGCPVTPRQLVNHRVGYAQGDGKVRYIGLPKGPVTRITAPFTPDSGVSHSAWGAQKVFWAFRDIEGVVEFRGRRLDAPGEVRFGHDRVPADVWRIGWMDGSHKWQLTTSLIRVKRPGCYAYDITAPGVRETIVFRAAVWRGQ